MSLTLDQLQPFCSTDESRLILMKPFSRPNGFTYATDGRILVRVPRIQAVAIGDLATVEQVTSGFQWDDVPAPLPPLCKKCSGACRNTCPTCSHAEECADCGGTGFDAENEYMGGEHASIEVGSQRFDCFYLRKIKDLPALQFFNATKAEHGARFTFDGGEGCLMPIMRRTA